MGGTLAAAGVIAGSHACRVRRNRCKRSVSTCSNNNNNALSTLYCFFFYMRGSRGGKGPDHCEKNRVSKQYWS